MFLWFYVLRQAKEVNDAMKVILPMMKKNFHLPSNTNPNI